jgi:hypothetical protein
MILVERRSAGVPIDLNRASGLTQSSFASHAGMRDSCGYTLLEEAIMRSASCLVVVVLLAACTASTETGHSPAGRDARKVGPASPLTLTTKPTTAVLTGPDTFVEPPTGGGLLHRLLVPGEGTLDTFTWPATIDTSGSQAECFGAFAADGSASIACGPFTATCANGTEIQSGALFLDFNVRNQIGAFAIAGSNLCGDAFDLMGCTFEGNGSVGSCGSAEIAGDHIDIFPAD